jgi:hypothetical protein
MNDLDLSMKVTRNGNLLLVKDDEVAVVRRGPLTPEFWKVAEVV